MTPELHYATDRRCYNGAMCSDLQREIDSQNRILKEIREQYPNFRICYFPVEGAYSAHLCYKEVSGNMFQDRGQCLLESWRILIGGTQPLATSTSCHI
mgnify:CR=1 FL=1